MKTEFSMQKIREFVKIDYPSVSARMCKSLLIHYDNLALDILVWYQAQSEQYRNETLLQNAVKDFQHTLTP